MLADCMDASLEAAHMLDPFASNLSAWQDYCGRLLASSPVLRSLVREHAVWFPRVAEFDRLGISVT